MALTLKKIEEAEWQAAFKNQYHSIFFDPDYLNLVKSAFNYNLHYYVCRKADNLQFAAALFSHKGKIVVPYAFTYNSIYFDKSIGDIIYVQIIEDFIKLLKYQFNNFFLRLPPSFTDLRPFIWAEFQISNRYTYYRESSKQLTNKLLKGIKKVENHLTFKVNNANQEDISLNLDICFRYGLPKKLYANYKYLFDELSEKGYLKSFCVYYQNELVCTQIAIIDIKSRSLSTISINDLNNRMYVSYLNYEIYKWCDQNGIDYIDMVGANEKGIANFKYSFNANLVPYFLVSYNRNTYFKHFAKKVKKVIKRLIRR